MYGMFAIITSWVGTRFLSVATVAREIFDLWEQAGCPSVPSMYPMKPATAMMVGLSFGPLMCGSIDHPGDKWRILKRVEMAEYGQRHLVYGKSIAFEGVWEPQSSPRVKFWKQEAEKAIAAANGATCWVSSLSVRSCCCGLSHRQCCERWHFIRLSCDGFQIGATIAIRLRLGLSNACCYLALYPNTVVHNDRICEGASGGVFGARSSHLACTSRGQLVA